MKYITEAVLRSSIGMLELARVQLDPLDISKSLAKAIEDEMWSINEGDVIEIVTTLTEE